RDFRRRRSHYPPGDSRTTEKAIRDFRAQRVHKSPKNVSDDGLENAPPTRAGNRAQIRPVVGLIPLWSQKLNSWRRATDSNHQYGLPHSARSAKANPELAKPSRW